MDSTDDTSHPDKSYQDKEDRKIEDAITEKYRNFQPDSKYTIRELEQEQLISEAISDEYQKRQSSSKKKLITIALVSIIAVAVLGTSLFFVYTDSEKYAMSYDPPTSHFLIQNLKGDTVDTWISWKVVEEDHPFHIHVTDSPYATEERLNAIVEVIMSVEEIEIDDSLVKKGPSGTSSTYYVGWMGALNSIDTLTESHIPKNIHSGISDKGDGDILIELSNMSSPDGYSGFTTAIVDEGQHQILKSNITIYDIEKISVDQLKIILRHELGHGFGLAHSSAPEDLMAQVITTPYPYISECDLDAIEFLYDGGKSSKVICEK